MRASHFPRKIQEGARAFKAYNRVTKLWYRQGGGFCEAERMNGTTLTLQQLIVLRASFLNVGHNVQF